MAQDTTPSMIIYQGDGSNNVFSVPFDKGYYGTVSVAFVRRGLTEYHYNPTTFTVSGFYYAWAANGVSVYTNTPIPAIGAEVFNSRGEATGDTVSFVGGSIITVNSINYARNKPGDINHNALLIWTGDVLNVGDFICIVRNTELGQPFTYPNNQKHIEEALDNLERQIQEVKSADGFALHVDPSYATDPNKMNPIDWLQTIIRSKDLSVRGLRFVNGWVDYSFDDPEKAEADKEWFHLLNTDNILSIREMHDIDEEGKDIYWTEYQDQYGEWKTLSNAPAWEKSLEEIKAVADEALEVAEEAKTIAGNADVKSDLAIQKSESAFSMATESLEKSDAALANSEQAVETSGRAEAKADSALSASERAEANSEVAVATSERAEQKVEQAITTAGQAVETSEQALAVANSANQKSDTAVATANEASSVANTALSNSQQAISTADSASAKADEALSASARAESKSDNAVAAAGRAESSAAQAVSTSNQALENSEQALAGVQSAVEAAQRATEAAEAAEQAVQEYDGRIQQAQDDAASALSQVGNKQDTLVSGTNIKTLNNQSILGAGNIEIASAQWGNIAGNIQDQTDLKESLDAKQDKLTEGNAGANINITYSGGGSVLPQGYVQYTFMESTGTQVVNAGTVSNGEWVEVVFSPTVIAGSAIDAYTGVAGMNSAPQMGYYPGGWTSGNNGSAVPYPPESGRIYTYKWTSSNGRFYIDDVWTNLARSGTLTLNLFQCESSSKSTRIYEVRKYNADNELVLHLYPALEDSSFRNGMYDIVNNVFYPSNVNLTPGNKIQDENVIISADLSDYATSEDLTQGLAQKQDTLVSGTNIKTVNNESLLGSGNIEIKGGGAVDSVNGKTGVVVLTGEDISADVNELTDTVQGHLQTLHDNIKDIELFKFPNATIIGEPIIDHGQVSGFSESSYLQFPFVVDLHNQPFVIDFCFTTGNDVTTQQNILDSQFGLALAIANGRGLMAISHNGTSWAGAVTGTMAIQPNTTYYARLSWNRILYKTELSTDGTTYASDMTFGSTQSPYPRTMFIGGCSGSAIGHAAHPFGGTINLNYAYLTVAGNVIWQGMDDAGLATRMTTDVSNITESGKERIKQIVGGADGETIKNQNTDSEITKTYNWTGTLKEAIDQDVRALHPDWQICITDDVSGGESVYTKTEVDEKFVNKTDTEYIGHQAMPSDRYINLTLATSGSTYTAPADGFIMIKISGTGGWTQIRNLTSAGLIVCNAISAYAGMNLPVGKGDIFQIEHPGSADVLRFIYAQGSK